MASVIDGIAATIGSALAGVFHAATLTVDVPGIGSDEFDPPAPTQTTYSCRAMVETYSERFRLDGLVAATDRRVMILGSSLATTPKAGDRITMSAGPYTGSLFTVMDAVSDPAKAVWTCRGRL